MSSQVLWSHRRRLDGRVRGALRAARPHLNQLDQDDLDPRLRYDALRSILCAESLYQWPADCWAASLSPQQPGSSSVGGSSLSREGVSRTIADPTCERRQSPPPPLMCFRAWWESLRPGPSLRRFLSP